MGCGNSKLIAKNTVILYVRMVFTMAVSLYTSRVVLNVLGVSDYGLYNVVGGCVLMFSFLNTAISVGIQRFLSYEIGRDSKGLHNLFNTSVNVQLIIAFIALILSETIGLWFLNTKIVIPEGRLEAANWVYQSVVISFIFMILSVPYTAILIAKEKMDAFAYISIFDTLLKLFIVLSIRFITGDKLKIYAFLLAVVSFFVILSYFIYCHIRIHECRYSFSWDKMMIKKLSSYSGWNLFGGISAVCNNYGINIILNMFFGPTVNAARGIAFQINTAIIGFTTNFQTAMNPQIVKSYAARDYRYMRSLIYNGAKYSFFLLLLITLPVLIDTHIILRIWLKIVPDNTVLFTRMVIITSLVDSLSGTIMTGSQASGKIKLYQSVVGSLTLLNLPIAYCLLNIFRVPIWAFVSSLFIAIVALFVRLQIVSKLIPISKIVFLKKVLYPTITIGVLSALLPVIVNKFMAESLFSLIITCILSWGWCAILLWSLGVDAKDKIKIIYHIKNKFKNANIYH